MRILIVDDSPVSREHLSYLVKQAGCSPLMFESAQELWSWSESNDLEETLILLDWVMPQLQGTELCRMIRAKYPSANSYIIMASAKSDSADVAEGLGAGADDYISKPFVSQEVVARLGVGMRTVRLRAELAEANRKRFVAERYAGVGQLAAGAAHEINNPLGFLKSNISLLKSELPKLIKCLSEPLSDTPSTLATPFEEMVEDCSEMLVDMQTGVERISAIVSSLRAFTAELPTREQGLDFAQMLQQVATESNIALELQLKHPVYGDSMQLRDCIQELINNARWATRAGGDISLVVSEVNGQARLVVSDTGCGIAPSDLARVADPFFTTRPVGEALGMGLSRAQAVIRNHGGDLRICSTQGEGTQVICELPLG